MNIGELLADKISSVALLSTVLRVDVSLHNSSDSRSQAIELLTNWINERTEARDLGFSWEDSSKPFSSGKFSLDWAEDEDGFTFALERPDSRQPSERSWLIDVALKRTERQLVLSTRLSVRQLKSTPLPPPGAPKFLSQIVDSVGAWDITQLSTSAVNVDKSEAEAFAAFATASTRTLPIIAISEDARRLTSPYHVYPEHLATVLGGTAHVVKLSRGASQWITDEYGKQYSAFWGAIRCFNAGFTFSSDPRAHRLWLDAEVDRAEALKRNGFAELAIRHTFAQVTASFESLPLISPRTVRRQIEIISAAREAQAKSEVFIAPAHASPTEEIGVREDIQQAQVTRTQLSTNDHILASLEQQIEEVSARLQSDLLSRAQYEDAQDAAMQALRAENAELAKNLAEERELREEYERENVKLEYQLAIYTGKSRATEDTLASRFLSAFATAFGSARDLIESQESLRKDVATSSSEVELLRDQLAQVRADKYSVTAQLLSITAKEDSLTDSVPHTSDVVLGQPRTLEQFFYGGDAKSMVITVTNQARKSFTESPYRDQPRMQMALELLRNCYVPMKLAKMKEDRDGLYEHFQQQLTANALTWGPTATDVGKGQAPEDHTQLTTDGRTIDCEKIRDKRSTFNRQDFLCVYFAWDDRDKHLYLKGFRHGGTPSAHT